MYGIADKNFVIKFLSLYSRLIIKEKNINVKSYS